MRRGESWLSILLLLAGCEACGSGSTNDPSAESARGSGGETTEEGTRGQSAADRGPAPTLGLSVEPARDGAANLIVENRGAEAVELSTGLVLERQDGTAWTTVDGIQGLALRFDCTQPVPECITLIPGAALHPPPWTGDIGDAQCACERCVDAPAGSYRFILSTCTGGHRVESPAFTR
jgi:hypothetical protein